MSDATTPAQDSSSADKPAPTVADLQAEVAAAREELVASIGELKAQTQPKALAERAGNNVKGFFTDEYGGIRPERVAIVAAVVVGFMALRLIRRRRR
jgi:hypothetical protein